MNRLNPLLCAIFGGLVTALLMQTPASQAVGADPYRVFEPQLNSPAVSLVAVTSGNGYLSDSTDLPVISRAIWVGGAGDVVAIGVNDGVSENAASTANAATLSITPGGNLPAYSSSKPGQYVICADGTNNYEIISGYLTGTTITVTTGGGSGGNTTANAHASGTLIAAYAPLKAANAGTPIPIRARRVMNSNTSATNLTELY